MSNVGKRAAATNSAGVRLRGVITSETFVEGTSLIGLDLDGTTSTIVIDYDDFEWRLIGPAEG